MTSTLPPQGPAETHTPRPTLTPCLPTRAIPVTRM